MSLINFRNGFFLTLGFSLGYMKAIKDQEHIVEMLKTIKDDPEFREKLNEVVEGFKEVVAKDEKITDEEKLDSLFDIDSSLELDRKYEIYGATVENPALLTDEEIKQMNLVKVKLGIGRGIYKVVGADGMIYGRDDVIEGVYKPEFESPQSEEEGRVDAPEPKQD